MKGLIITEHGNALSWLKKKNELEKNGMKYVFACEGYVTSSREADNSFHLCIYGLNNEGRREINQLISNAYKRDRSFYRRPRMMIDDVLECENIAIATACLASALARDIEGEVAQKLLAWGLENKDKFFLEIQPHDYAEQIEYNKKLIELSKQHGYKLIASNDVHYTDKFTGEVRTKMQQSKGMNFTDEDSFDLSLKSYDEMLLGYIKQGIDESIAKESLANTNVLYDMAEEYEVDKSFKYPNLYDNPIKMMTDRCLEEFKNKGFVGNKEYADRLIQELEVYRVMGAESYMLLFSDWIRGLKDDGIHVGYSRGSSSGSIVSYLLGITEIDPIMFKTSFSRFMNEHRVSLADIDVDIAPNERDRAKEWFYGVNGLNCSDIITFGTEQEAGAIDMMGRGFNLPLREVENIKNNVSDSRKDEKYTDFFKYVDITIDTTTKIGRHPAGVLVSDLDIEKEIGLITITDKTTEKGYRTASQLNMKELEELGYVKADALGLANIGVINKTFEYIGMERLNPQTCDFTDMNVWNNIKKSPVGIFQFEAEKSHEQLAQAIDNIRGTELIKVMSFVSGCIRPSGASIRKDYLSGKKYDNGHEAINEFYKGNSGYIIYQEDLISFLTQFCGYSEAMADVVRRAVAKKGDTRSLINDIRIGFKNNFSQKYNVSGDECDKLVNGFLEIVELASDYSFSYNHAITYSITGFICGWLRTYHEKEFITANLNEFKDKTDKMKEIFNYIKQHTNLKIEPPRFGKATMEYSYDKERDIIYEGLYGAKGLSKNTEQELNKIDNMQFNSFFELLIYMKDNDIKLSSSDISILIKLDFFKEFGNQKALLDIAELTVSSESKLSYKSGSITKAVEKYDGLRSELNELNNSTINNIIDMIIYIKDNKLKISATDIKFLAKIGVIELGITESELSDILSLALGTKSAVKYTSVKSEELRMTKREALYNHVANIVDMDNLYFKLNEEVDIKVGVLSELYNIVAEIESSNEDLPEIQKSVNELQILGHTSKIFPSMENEFMYILDRKKPYSTYIVKTFSLKTGEIKTYKVKKDNMIAEKDQLILVNATEEKEGSMLVDGKWQKTGMFHSFIESMSVVKI
jgi:DNA polymerase-3 subunit alpha